MHLSRPLCVRDFRFHCSGRSVIPLISHVDRRNAMARQLLVRVDSYRLKGVSAMVERTTYKPKHFNLSGLKGISDKTLQMHFKLYEGYVKSVNELNQKIAEVLKHGKVDQEEFPAYSELTRRLGFEYNGMVLHEYYFGNLKAGGAGQPNPAFKQEAEFGYGSYETWKVDFAGVGKMRGVGWAICYQDPVTGALSNHWIELHEI